MLPGWLITNCTKTLFKIFIKIWKIGQAIDLVKKYSNKDPYVKIIINLKIKQFNQDISFMNIRIMPFYPSGG